MKKVLIITAVVGLGLLLAGGSAAYPLQAKCSSTKVTKCQLFIDKNGVLWPADLTVQGTLQVGSSTVTITGDGINAEAAVVNGSVLTVNNTDPFADRGASITTVNGTGLFASGSSIGVEAEASDNAVLATTDNNGNAVSARSDPGGILFAGWESFAPGAYMSRFKVTSSGDVYADGTYFCGENISDSAGTLDEAEIAPCLTDSTNADFAEMMAAGPGLVPGDVLIIGQDGLLTKSAIPYQDSLVGVYSTRPSYLGNGSYFGEAGYVPLAITGIVPVKVTAENGAIQPGDLLTTSATPGHAMLASPVTINGVSFYLPGTILGKALEPLEEGTGMILVLVTLQ